MNCIDQMIKNVDSFDNFVNFDLINFAANHLQF